MNAIEKKAGNITLKIESVNWKGQEGGTKIIANKLFTSMQIDKTENGEFWAYLREDSEGDYIEVVDSQVGVTK